MPDFNQWSWTSFCPTVMGCPQVMLPYSSILRVEVVQNDICFNDLQMISRVDAYLGDRQKQVRTIFGDDPFNSLLMAAYNLDARLLHTKFGFESIRNGTCTRCFHVENADLHITGGCGTISNICTIEFLNRSSNLSNSHP